jgi:hypothetical protein
MAKASIADNALVGLAVTLAAQDFDNLAQAAEKGQVFTNKELHDIFRKFEDLMDGLSEFFIQQVREDK